MAMMLTLAAETMLKRLTQLKHPSAPYNTAGCHTVQLCVLYQQCNTGVAMSIGIKTSKQL